MSTGAITAAIHHILEEPEGGKQMNQGVLIYLAFDDYARYRKLLPKRRREIKKEAQALILKHLGGRQNGKSAKRN